MKVVYYNLDKREFVSINDFAGIITKSLGYKAELKGSRWNLAQPNESKARKAIHQQCGLAVLLCDSTTYPGEQTHLIENGWIGRWHGDRITIALTGYANANTPVPTYAKKFVNLTNQVENIGLKHLKNEQILKD